MSQVPSLPRGKNARHGWGITLAIDLNPLMVLEHILNVSTISRSVTLLVESVGAGTNTLAHTESPEGQRLLQKKRAATQGVWADTARVLLLARKGENVNRL